MRDLFNILLQFILAPYRILLHFCSKYKKSNTEQEAHNQYRRCWERTAKIPHARNLDKVKWNDTDIKLVAEHNAVALYKGEFKLGYLHNEQTQEMVLRYLRRKDYLIKTTVRWLNAKNKKYKLAVKITFYRKTTPTK